MDRLEHFIYLLDETIDSPRKRHLLGGILLSVSLLFGGLAFTSFTLKEEEIKNGRDNRYLHNTGNGWGESSEYDEDDE